MNNRILGIIGGLALVVALLSPYVLGNSKKVTQLFEIAEKLYENSDYEAAIVKYEEALKESNKLLAKPESIDEDFTTLVNFKIAMSYVKLAKQSDDTSYYEKALEHVERADHTVKIAEYAEKLTYLWGYVLYKIGDLDQGKEKLTQLVKNFPNSPLVKKAEEIIEYITQKQNTEGPENRVPHSDSTLLWINDLSKFEAFQKKKNRSLIIADRLRVEKQYREAAELYEVFANTDPPMTETAYALYWAGWCYYEVASDDKTLISKSDNIFRRLINSHSDSRYADTARRKLEDIESLQLKCESTKVINAAREIMHRADQLDCKSGLLPQALTYLNDAKQEQAQGNYEKSIEFAKKTNQLAMRAVNNHEKVKGYVGEGYTYLRQGKLDAATELGKEARRLHPSYQKSKGLLGKIKQKYLERGVNYIVMEEYAKAIPSLKKAIDIDSQFKEGYCYLGRAYVKLGEFEKAIMAAKKALAIDPNYKCAHEIIDSID